ncbi:MAG: class I SAM-dependent methyltransferase [Candidatus Margulisiibacteriota bacterium]|jgi:2-polyprenyl-3-methyl-5-hydroxy-6-metoxy-1,4-benzoquinol methylase
MNIEEIEKKYPYFYKTHLYLKDNIFYKNVLETSDDIAIDYELAEKLCYDAFKLCQFNWEIYFKKLFNLLEINIEFLKLQASLEETGKYLYTSFNEVEENVYKSKDNNQSRGVNYLWGLYFTQIFWVTHHRVLKFFIDEFINNNKDGGVCLEAPSGNGVFLTHFLINNKNWQGIAVDLSDTSIDFTKKMLNLDEISQERVKIIKGDINEYQSDIKFDRIICGEFLEHVEDPLAILKKLNSLLADDGKLFLTTVAWTAFIDHIYLYRNVNEIKKHIFQGGFKINKELIQNIFDKDKNNPDQDKKAILYAAVLEKS